MPRHVSAGVDDGDDVTTLAANHIDDAIRRHQDFAEVIDSGSTSV